MWRVRVVRVVAALFASSPVLAQTGSITGRVTAADTVTPVIGAQVTVAGMQLGTITGDDGRYTIARVPAGRYTVRAQRIGFAADSVTGVAVTAGAATTADFYLRPVAVTLATVDVIGYGERQARERTGSVATVTSKEFNTGRVVAPQQLIEAKVPGVEVVDNNEPGGGISLRIRGGASVTSSNEPLYVIDGVPLSNSGGIRVVRNPNNPGLDTVGRNPLSFLNPEDIESITVLKDASATAIYGSRGANGVVLITTKTGASAPRISYTGTVSGSTITREPSMLNAAQFRAAVQQFTPQNLDSLGNANTDWLRQVRRDAAFGQEHFLALAGKREDMNYRVSLGYLDQNGILEGTSLKRLSASLGYNDVLFNNQLDISANVKGSRSDDHYTPSAVIGEAIAFAPTQPVRTPDGSFFQWSNSRSTDNPVAELDLVTDEATAYRSVGNIEGKYRLPFLEGLSTTLRLGYDVTKGDRTSFFPSNLQSQIDNGFLGTVQQFNPTENRGVVDAFANYVKTLSDNSDIDLTAGYSYERSRIDNPFLLAQGLSSNLLGPNGIPGADVQRNTLTVDEGRLESVFGRINYTLKDRYLLTLSIRRDGSSKFAPANQWGTFPSAALAWRVSEESFMKGLSALSDLKLRASWGVNGNQDFPSYQFITSYTLGDAQAQQWFDNGFVTTIRPSAVDPNIKWEQTRSYDLGFDYGLFNSRITGTFDYYYKKTKDLIFNVPVAAGTNLSNFVTTNIGTVKNHGFEFGLNARVFEGGSRGFTWDAGFNASTNTNELLRVNVVESGDEAAILVGSISGGVGNFIEVLKPGYPINSFFVYEHKRDAAGNPIYADANGDGTVDAQDLYVDINGDGEINQSDRRPFHDPAPTWILGHTSTMSFRNWDLSFTARAYLGNYVYNNVASNLGNYDALDPSGGNPNNLHSSVLANGFEHPQYFSDVYVERASFLRMDNITLGYSLTYRGQPMRLFATVQNAFTITGYSGVDPTAAGNGGAFGASNVGIDNNIYPRSRTFSGGLSVKF